MSEDRPNLLTSDEIAAIPRETFGHPLNPNAEMHAFSLSDTVGLERVGFHMIRIPPGREANIVHAHRIQEEFFYILSGRGVATIDGQRYEVGPGDFMGFPTPSVAHGLANPFDEDLVYLVGGERQPMEIGTFPQQGKILIRHGQEAWFVDEEALEKADWTDADRNEHPEKTPDG